MTIFNVLLSAYANDKTVLVCSNNNHPVSDIFNKMYMYKTILCDIIIICKNYNTQKLSLKIQ